MQCARHESRPEGYDRADGNVPGPGNRSEEPEVKAGGETHEQAHGSADFGGSHGEYSEEEDAEKSAVGDRSDLQSDFDDAAHSMQAEDRKREENDRPCDGGEP